MALTFRIRKELLGEILGLAGDDAPGSDESAVSTLHIRLDEMFREAIRDAENIILLHAEDLAKLARSGDLWRRQAKTFSLPELVFPRERGVNEGILRQLNNAPATLALNLRQTGRLLFCQSPVFEYTLTGPEARCTVWLHAVFAPHTEDEKEEVSDEEAHEKHAT